MLQWEWPGRTSRRLNQKDCPSLGQRPTPERRSGEARKGSPQNAKRKKPKGKTDPSANRLLPRARRDAHLIENTLEHELQQAWQAEPQDGQNQKTSQEKRTFSAIMTQTEIRKLNHRQIGTVARQDDLTKTLRVADNNHRSDIRGSLQNSERQAPPGRHRPRRPARVSSPKRITGKNGRNAHR